MEGDVSTDAGPTEAPRRRVPRVVRAHAFLTAAVVAALIGGGIRFVPIGTAAAAGSGSGSGSTACAAR